MSKFRTIDISDPRFESDNLRYITVKSQHLKGRGDITVFVPDDIADLKNVPLLILLHGVYGSHWGWTAKGGVHLTAKKLIEAKEIEPMIIAMPSDGLWGDGSAYVPHHNQDFEKWIAEDVPGAVGEMIPQFSIDTSLMFISGLSMGGYGALRLGAKYAEKFNGISAHSSITRIEETQGFLEEDIAEIPYKSGEMSAIDWMLKNKHLLPPIRFDCGREDSLIEANRTLHQQLKESNIPHVYEEFDGAHDWGYWEKYVKCTLTFCNQLNAEMHRT